MASCIGLGSRIRALEAGGPITPTSGGTFFILTSADNLETDNTSAAQEIIVATVPAAVTWTLISAKVICRAYGKFIITADGVKIGGGVTSPIESNVTFDEWLPGLVVVTGQEIKVIFTQCPEGPQVDLTAFLGYTEQA